MSEIKQNIRQNISLPISRQIQTILTRGRVTYSDERENVCNVIYTNRSGVATTRNSVPVRIDSADSWFPAYGETVLLDISGNMPVIIGRDFLDYNAQVRPEHRLSHDIFSDASIPIGNQIG